MKFNLQLSMDSVKVSINGHPISERALRKAEKKAGPVSPGSYWYDQRAGFWGVMGHECSGIIPPFIKEFSYSMPKNCAGNVIDATTGDKLRSLGKLAPTIEKMKRGFGMHVPEEIS
ncbi:hypothetical protein ACQJBY_004375 [Aegilops geniculata]